MNDEIGGAKGGMVLFSPDNPQCIGQNIVAYSIMAYGADSAFCAVILSPAPTLAVVMQARHISAATAWVFVGV
jgi:hypothetical protein